MRTITIWLQRKQTNEIFQGIVFSDEKKKMQMTPCANELMGFWDSAPEQQGT